MESRNKGSIRGSRAHAEKAIFYKKRTRLVKV